MQRQSLFNRNTHCALAIIAIALLSACSSKRDFVYIQDMTPGDPYVSAPRAAAVVQPDDRLAISVTCKTPELAAPFNPTATGTASAATEGYSVNSYGDIEFPLLGTVHVAGCTLDGVQELIKQRIIEGNYIKEPIVTARFLNFKYTILGAVSSNGVYTVDGERITLLEAIAKAGDLTRDAITDRVYVIREEPDGRKKYVHDLRSTEIFDSPCFYLQQNDIVYVEPKDKAGDKEKRESRAWQFTTVAISAASVITTILWITKD